MFDLLIYFIFFLFGMSIGKFRAVNADITKQTAYMQDLINKAYIERDEHRMAAIHAQDELESWKRRYDVLLDYINELEEEEVGSGSSRNGTP